MPVYREDVVYRLLEQVEQELCNKLESSFEERELGRAKVQRGDASLVARWWVLTLLCACVVVVGACCV